MRARPLASLASGLALALAVALLGVTIGTRRAVEKNMEEPAALCDLIVGPKGSGTELFLSAALGVLPPRGRVAAGVWSDLEADPRVIWVAPIEVEDNVRGWRVVATTERHPLFAASDNLGDFFRTGERIAVVGQVAARALGLKPGDTFVTSHAIGENAAPWEVVEILGARGYLADRTIFVPAASHHHASGADSATTPLKPVEDREPEANAILVKLSTPLDLLPMLRQWNEAGDATAADPRAEITLLRSWLSSTDRYVRMAGVVVVLLAALSIVVGMVARAEERKREAAIIRVTGGSIGTAVLVEVIGSLILGSLAGVAGLALGALLLGVNGLPFLPGAEEIGLAVLVMAAGVLASLVTSLQLARLSLDETLRPER